MINYEIVTLENGHNYAITKEINSYIYLVNPEDELDFCIRKVVIRNNEEYIETLEDEKEVDYALSLFAPEK